ncbi:hypothetical protein G6F58_012817 [Rhizopus delemar]|nr:hypothetical protein G6F58_012817 [Rhizopus delemar]
MALLDRKFVHCKYTDSGKVHRSQRLLQVPEIKRLDSFPVQTMPLCRGMDRGSSTHPCNALCQSLRDPAVPIQPVQMLQPRPTTRAGHALPLHLQLDRLIEHRQITDTPDHLVVDGGDPLGAAAAAAPTASIGEQRKHQPRDSITDFASPIIQAIPRPGPQQRHTIQLGHGRPQFVVSTTTI